MNRREYQCTVCRQNHPHFQGLESHYKQKHDQVMEPPFVCSICDENFILEEALLYHQKIEHSQEIYVHKCEECQLDFFLKGIKTVHDVTYHDLPYAELIVCKFCSEVSESVNEILNHHQTYHEMNPLPFFKCTYQSSETFDDHQAQGNLLKGIDKQLDRR